MKKTRTYKIKWASILIVVIFLGTTIGTVNADPLNEQGGSESQKKWIPPTGPSHYPVWVNENWDEYISEKVAVDSQDNVITVGMIMNEDHTTQGVVTKLSRDTGAILWNTNPTSLLAQSLPLLGGDTMPPVWYTLHQYDSVMCPVPSRYSVIMWDVAVDPQDNVLTITEVYDESDPGNITSDAYVIKLDGNTGEQLWFRQIDLSMYDSYLSITINQDGYPYITGVSVGLTPIPHLDGWVAKLAKNDLLQGLPIRWNHNAYQNPNPWYTHIDHDEQNNVYVTGGLVSIQWFSDHGVIESMQTVVDKYDCTDLSAEGRYRAIDFPVDSMGMSVAVKGGIVVVAGVYDINQTQGPQKQLIIKLDTNLQWGWHRNTDNDGCFFDVAIWNHKNTDYVVATGYKNYVNAFFTTIRKAENGAHYYTFTQVGNAPNSIAWSYGVAVDSEEYIIITGEEVANINGQWYECGLTIKNFVTDDPVLSIEELEGSAGDPQV